MKKKVLTIECETDLNNDDLSDAIIDNCTDLLGVVQVMVMEIQAPREEEPED